MESEGACMRLGLGREPVESVGENDNVSVWVLCLTQLASFQNDGLKSGAIRDLREKGDIRKAILFWVSSHHSEIQITSKKVIHKCR